MNSSDSMDMDPTPQPHAATARVLEAAIERSSPPIAGVLKFFRFSHLPLHLQDISAKFAGLAADLTLRSSNAETTVALRKLLESKDAAVRSVLP